MRTTPHEPLGFPAASGIELFDIIEVPVEP
jgi:hypothetical protein